MHPEGIILYEISQKDKHHMISLTRGIYPKKKKKDQNKNNTETIDTENRLLVVRSVGWGRTKW